MSKRKWTMAISLVFAAVCLAQAMAADTVLVPMQGGKVIQHAKMPSAIMGRDVPYTIYLPPDYDTSERDYPIVYLLHGGGGNDADWVNNGEIKHVMDKGIADGTLTPMIIACHDASRNEQKVPRTFFQNDADGKLRWGDMFTEEFMPFIEKNYRVRPKARGIGGLSMGGYGALMFALQKPGSFQVVIALSATVFTPEQFENMTEKDYHVFFSKAYGEELKGRDRLSEFYYKSNPLALMNALPAEDLKKQKLFFDCGAEDGLKLYEGNAAMHKVLMDKGVPHDFTIRAGAHTWSFWRKGIVEGLRFATGVFHR